MNSFYLKYYYKIMWIYDITYILIGVINMTTPYQNIARAALMNWNGLSTEETNYKIQNETVEQLENQIGALPTIEYCVLAISELSNLTDEETISFIKL